MEGRKKKSDNNYMQDLIETVSYAFLGVVIAIVIYNALTFVLHTNRPVIDVVSQSMVPTINVGDLVIVQKVPQQDIKIGDIIVFDTLAEPLPVIHRVYKINDDGTFQTLGDNNNGQQHEWEKKIEYKDIVGREVLIIPYIGWVKITVCNVIPSVCKVLSSKP